MHYLNIPVLITIQKIPLHSHISNCLCIISHCPYGGCPHTVWISNILSKAVADLIHLGDHISSYSSFRIAAGQHQLCYAFCAYNPFWIYSSGFL